MAAAALMVHPASLTLLLQHLRRHLLLARQRLAAVAKLLLLLVRLVGPRRVACSG
jgi:hypothetical protein